MSQQSSCSPVEPSPLPQYGFASELSFDKLVESNPFLYRVYTPKKRSPFYDESEPFFVGHCLDERFTVFSPTTSRRPGSSKLNPTYEDVVRHMDWTTRSQSPYISTSFSFIWAMWEAARRYQGQMKHDVEIAVIDARSLVGRAVTAVELLRLSDDKQRNSKFWKWYRFALEAQDVLVYEAIPQSSVLTSIPLLRLLEQLPSYFVKQLSDIKTTPLNRLAWDPKEAKPSFRLFCQDMSSRFFKMPLEHRLRDSSASAVHLATTFLRPWFHQMVMDDFDLATTKAGELSRIIAAWPGGHWWSRDHPEIWELIKGMVLLLAEELREKLKVDMQGQVTELQDRLEGMEKSLQEYEDQVCSHLENVMASSPVSNVPSPTIETSPAALEDAVHHPKPRSPIEFADVAPFGAITGLLTPPSSPPPAPRRRARSLRTPLVRFDSLILPPTPEVDEFDLEPKYTPLIDLTTEEPETIELVPKPLHDEIIYEEAKIPLPVEEPQQKFEDHLLQEDDVNVPSIEDLSLDLLEVPKAEPKPQPEPRPQSTAETVSAVVTGLLFFTFVAMCITNSQRRTLLFVT